MALQKQLVPLQIDGGLDTKSDDKQASPGFLRRAENLVYETIKKLRKRNGYDRVRLETFDGSSLEDVKVLAKYKTELLALSAGRLYSYSTERMAFADKGPLYAVSTPQKPVARNSQNMLKCDSIVVDNFNVFVWSTEDGEVRYSVQDLTDDSFLVSNGLVAEGERPVVSKITNDVYVIYGDGADLCYKRFSILQPLSLSSATIVASDRHLTDGLIACELAGSSIVVAYNSDNSGDDLVIFKIEPDGGTSSLIGINGESAAYALHVHLDESSRIVVTYSDGIYVKILIYALNLNAALLAPTIVDSVDNEQATAMLDLTVDIELTSVSGGATRNGHTVTTQVLAAAPNPTDTVLVDFSGTLDAIVITVTPNDGTFNSSVSVNLMTDELVELINTGAVVGLNITLTDPNNLRTTMTATGGGNQNMTDGGEGDGIVATFADGTSFPITTCCSIDASAAIYDIYYEVSQSGPINNYVKKATATLAGSVSGISVFCRSVGLAANVFDYESTHYVPVVLDSEIQSSYFLLDEDGHIVTKWANQLASGPLEQGVISHIFPVSDDNFLVASLFRNRLRSENGTFFSVNGVGKSNFNFAPVEPFSNAELADSLHICAGILRVYDGSTVTEHGFHVYPEDLQEGDSETMGGFMSDGNYGFVAVYKWTDNTGKDHRSAPTPLPLTVELAGGGSTQTVDIVVPTLRLTEKEGVIVELYQTEDDGTQYYLAGTAANDKTVDSVTITASLADATLISQELLYTTGGVLENIPAPACSIIETYNGDRLVVSGDDGTRIYFSKETGEGTPVEFTDVIYRDVAPAGGPITMLRALGEKLVIGQQGALHYVSGDGPLNTGQQDTLSKPEVIATDIGSLSQAGSILTPNGLLFKSRKGIWKLGGGLDLAYTGAGVELFNSDTVTSASIVGDLNQVRFLLSSTRALVYNYDLNRWATFENHGGLSSVAINRDYYYLRPDGVVYKENRESFADNSSPIKMRMQTSWLTLAELQGYQRAHNLFILGQFRSRHKLRVKISYDFVDSWVSESIIDTADFVEVAPYGSDETYGGRTTPYGGYGSLYQMRIDLETQKCTAIKISIEDIQSEVGEGFSLSGITVRASVKEGGNKLAAANKFGPE